MDYFLEKYDYKTLRKFNNLFMIVFCFYITNFLIGLLLIEDKVTMYYLIFPIVSFLICWLQFTRCVYKYSNLPVEFMDKYLSTITKYTNITINSNLVLNVVLFIYLIYSYNILIIYT